MDSSGSQQNKPRKPSSISKRFAGAPTVASARTGGSPNCLSATSGALAGVAGYATLGTDGGTGWWYQPSAIWSGMSLGGSSPGSSECRIWSCSRI
ncbi:unnamed protein product [Urochloa humidicola]